MTDTEIPATAGDTGGDVSSPQLVSSLALEGANLTPAALTRPAAGGFWQHRWGDSRLWTVARDARLKAGWEAGEEQDTIRAALNALPGKPITAGYALTGRARLRGFKRPEWFLRAMSQRGGFARSAWTPARIAYIQDAYPRGESVEAILTALNALPGNAIPTCEAVRCWANNNGVSRPANYGPIAAARTKAIIGPWNLARREKLVELWPDVTLSTAEVATQINSIPGPRDVSANACQRKAWDMRLAPRQRGPKPKAVKAPKPPRVRAPKATKPVEPKPQKQRLGERNTFVFCAQATPREPDEPPPEYDAARPGSVEARVEKAKAMLKARQDAFDIAKATNLPLWRVHAIIGQLRMERAG